MRIGFDATALPPRPVGAGNYIIHLGRTLAQQAEIEELILFVQRSRLSLIDIGQQSRARVVVIPDMPTPVRLLWEQVILPVWVKRMHIDLLHSPHYTMPYIHPCPQVVTLHDMTFFLFPELHTRAKRILFPQIIRASAHCADMLIADSESSRQDVLRLLGIKPEKIKTTLIASNPGYAPVSDPECLQVVQKKYALPERFILFVGLIEPRKNLPLLLRAYHQVQHELVDHRLVIVGRAGWESERVFEMVDQLGLGDRVVFTGYVQQEDLSAVYSLADVFVYPSLYEGFGIPVLEAMMCGAPVITTNVSSMPEITGSAGLLIPPGDENALVEALRYLLMNEAERIKLAENGRQRAALFSWEKTARETVGVYQQVLRGR